MKKVFKIMMFGLLLAVGWTNVAQAQLKAECTVKKAHKSLMLPATKVSD